MIIFATEFTNLFYDSYKMRTKVLLMACMSMALFGCNALGADFRAVYHFEYTKDSIHSVKGEDILYLEISDNSSLCFSYHTYYTDSLHATPDGDAVWRKLFSAALAKEGINATSFPHKCSKFLVTKYPASDTIRVKDVIDQDIYEYDAFKSEFSWQLCDSAKQINGFEAYKATCRYHGREWTVWFSPDIPVSDGPWVFCGLPGLILETQDKDHLFFFRLTGLTSNPSPKKDWLGKGKRTDRISFLRKRHHYLKNLTRIFNAEMGINVPEGKDTRYLDGLEPDFKQ